MPGVFILRYDILWIDVFLILSVDRSRSRVKKEPKRFSDCRLNLGFFGYSGRCAYRYTKREASTAATAGDPPAGGRGRAQRGSQKRHTVLRCTTRRVLRRFRQKHESRVSNRVAARPVYDQNQRNSSPTGLAQRETTRPTQNEGDAQTHDATITTRRVWVNNNQFKIGDLLDGGSGWPSQSD